MFGFACCVVSAQSVVINEIHYDPPDRTRREEFVELFNAGPDDVLLTGWKLEGGVQFEFPGGTQLASGRFLVVAQDTNALRAAFAASSIGPWQGRLRNTGESIRLLNAAGTRVDEVRFAAGFPWPTDPRGAGASMELIHPGLDNSQPGAWRSSAIRSPVPSQVFLPSQSPGWRYFKGRQEPSAVRGAWKEPEFVESADWLTGTTSIGYGDGDDQTPLADMQGNYTSLYFRHRFVVTNSVVPDAIVVRARVDDGCIVWINGLEAARFHVPASDPRFDSTASDHEASAQFEEVVLGDAARFLKTGTNWVAVHGLNATLGSSDFTMDLELRTPEPGIGSRSPSPGNTNRVWSTAPQPMIRNAWHDPEHPRPGETVRVRISAANASAVTRAVLEYQPVLPGQYLRKSDPAFATNWSVLPMTLESPTNWVAEIPGSQQVHRRLMRYRFRLVMNDQSERVAPFDDDESPNFAWLTLGELAAWSGANRPGVAGSNGVVRTFPTRLFEQIPSYMLLARQSDVLSSQYDSSGNGVRMWGTLVVEGHVYDHVQFNNRGEASTYVSGKNKWRFHFNRARRLHARDRWGRPYERPWDVLNLNGCSSPWAAVHRGMAGVDEALAFRVYELLGVPSSRTHHLQFRVIDQASETGATQYDGDLWGLYLAVEQPDGSFLDDRELPDGNIYKLEGGPDKKHQGATQSIDASDWNTFASQSQGGATDSWWRTNMDMGAFYSFVAGNRLTGNVDLRDSFNHYFYHSPERGWTPMPWDLDMQFFPKTHWSGEILQSVALARPALRLEYRNRAREVIDLLLSDGAADGGQIGQLIDEFTDELVPDEFNDSWPRLDQFLWNWHPRTAGDGSSMGQTGHKGNFYRQNYSDSRIGGSWTRVLSSTDFFGSMRYLLDYCTDTFTNANWVVNNGNPRGYAHRFLQREASDTAIPDRPVIRYTGPGGHPLEGLSFEASEFTDPQGAESGRSIRWRIAEISAPGIPGFELGTPRKYEIQTVWDSGERDLINPTIRVFPGDLFRGATYRVRARYTDNTGRASSWSLPIQWTSSTNLASTLSESLGITELMFHPSPASAVEAARGWDADDFEFLELRNQTWEPLRLDGLQFVEGIGFEFSENSVLAGGEAAVLVRNLAAFRSRYGNSPRVLGVFSGGLSDGGETLVARLGRNVPVLRFGYSDDGGWPVDADGRGRSLVYVGPRGVPSGTNWLHWIAGRTTGGTPGRGEGIRYSDWAGGKPELADRMADPDGDGFPNWLEFVLGRDPAVAVRSAYFEMDRNTDQNQVVIRIRRRGELDAARVRLEMTSDWKEWNTNASQDSPVANPDATVTEVWRVPIRTGSPGVYVRIQWEFAE